MDIQDDFIVDSDVDSSSYCIDGDDELQAAGAWNDLEDIAPINKSTSMSISR